MDENLLDLLRCPFCGGRFALLDNAALVRNGSRLDSGVIWCECCAFPIVAGIPVLIADDPTRDAMHALEAGRHQDALFMLLGLHGDALERFQQLLRRGEPPTYREAIALLSPDPEGTCFIYRFSDPTFVMVEAIVRALAQQPSAFDGRTLDLCGGSGHLTRLLAGLHPGREVVLADKYFWKLWLARTITAPTSIPVCCDGNQPLPFVPATFRAVVLSDSFPYIWQKRLLADEMVRLTAPGGTILMPHLHSSLGENFSAGMTLTPESYRNLFAAAAPRLFSDQVLLDQALAGGAIDLTGNRSPEELGTEPSFTLVASHREEVFRRYQPSGLPAMSGTLVVNPLYGVERRGTSTVLTLQFPTPEYEEEFRESRRYLLDSLTLEGDLSGVIAPEAVGPRLDELRQRRILIDAPSHYC